MAAPPVRLLPTNLAPAAVGALYRGPDRVVIGQREEDLAPVLLDFAENPLLMVFGDGKSGKTTLLRHIIRTIREHSSADRVAFTVLDRRLHLVDEPLFPDNEYTANIDRIMPAMLGLANLIESRRPPAGLSPAELSRWTYQGHTHYLIIDDVDQIPDSPAMSGPYVGQRPWTPLHRVTRAGQRSGTAGDRHGPRHRIGARADDQPVAAPLQRLAGDHVDVVGQSGRQRQDPRSAVRPAARRPGDSVGRQ